MKKYLLSLLSLTIAATPVVTTVSCGLFSGGNSNDKSDLDFYNYEDYMDEDIQKNIGNYYNYQQFGDLPELEVGIRQQKAVGGIGSDYFNANLIKSGYDTNVNSYNGLLMKLDLSKIFNLSPDRSKWENELKNIYTPEAWAMLNSFDNSIGDVDHDGINDKLWEYAVPYFAQNKVIAFNKSAITLPGVDMDNQEKIQEWFKNNTDLSYEGIFSALKENGANKITINDYFRDNMMIGSEVIAKKANKGLVISGNPAVETNTTKILTDRNEIIANGKKQINAFVNMVNSFNWTKRIYYTSGIETLETIVTQSNGARDSDVALMYNGDAMAAANGGYNTGSTSNEVRIIVPKNSTFLSDNIVLANYLKDDINEQNRFYKVVRELILSGVETSSDYFAYKGYWNKAWKNYTQVNYTPAYENVYKYMAQNFFKDESGKDDKNKKFIGQSTRVAATGGSTNIDTSNPIKDISSKLAQPISNDMSNTFVDYFDQKQKNT